MSPALEGQFLTPAGKLLIYELYVMLDDICGSSRS